LYRRWVLYFLDIQQKIIQRPADFLCMRLSDKTFCMLQLNFTPFPELTTERLLLRKITMADAPAIFYLRSDQLVLQYLSKAPAASIKEAEDFITRITNDLNNNDGILWGITLNEAPESIIGTICYWRLDKAHYRAELGYALAPAYWRKGIMKEAIIKVLDYGYSVMGLHSIEGRISPGNIASASILEATGFVREAYFKEDFFYDGKFEDTAVYSRLQQ
jgi:[ribosomal protein S5]-alanine N-acetyltransferase